MDASGGLLLLYTRGRARVALSYMQVSPLHLPAIHNSA